MPYNNEKLFNHPELIKWSYINATEFPSIRFINFIHTIFKFPVIPASFSAEIIHSLPGIENCFLYEGNTIELDVLIHKIHSMDKTLEQDFIRYFIAQIQQVRQSIAQQAVADAKELEEATKDDVLELQSLLVPEITENREQPTATARLSSPPRPDLENVLTQPVRSTPYTQYDNDDGDLFDIPALTKRTGSQQALPKAKKRPISYAAIPSFEQFLEEASKGGEHVEALFYYIEKNENIKKLVPDLTIEKYLHCAELSPALAFNLLKDREFMQNLIPAIDMQIFLQLKQLDFELVLLLLQNISVKNCLFLALNEETLAQLEPLVICEIVRDKLSGTDPLPECIQNYYQTLLTQAREEYGISIEGYHEKIFQALGKSFYSSLQANNPALQAPSLDDGQWSRLGQSYLQHITTLPLVSSTSHNQTHGGLFRPTPATSLTRILGRANKLLPSNVFHRTALPIHLECNQAPILYHLAGALAILKEEPFPSKEQLNELAFPRGQEPPFNFAYISELLKERFAELNKLNLVIASNKGNDSKINPALKGP